jgi:hypothetical protein
MDLLELWRWPVKGAAGETTPSVRVDARGVGGDRTHAVLTQGPGGWAPLSAAQSPALAGWRAAYPFAVGAALDPEKPPYAVLTAPNGRQYQWGDPRLRTALEDCLGCPVRLHRDPAGQQHVPRSIVVTTTAQASGAAVLRSNLHLDADASDWAPGSELRFSGGVRLRVLAPVPGMSFIHARVVANGRIAAGEQVELVESGPPRLQLRDGRADEAGPIPTGG